MLHRSFKPAKCKTSLKLATSRLKLLKNKKEVQLKQMKRELAQLLESGQDQTARIRVEHVVREEKTIAAYELLEIYCELIVARLPIIESQKNCPIDMKEAVTSVMFATPRCSDIPELQDIRKHFTAKYGKEFITAAVELRPQCGVSRMLVEKLSANAPDGPTKVKILSGIAEEHNIKWDHKSFGETELKPREDLLNGPSTFEMASRMHTEASIVQTPPSQVQAPPTPVNLGHNAGPSTRSENFASKDGSGSQAAMRTPPHPGVRPSGNRYERTEVRHSSSGDGNSFPSDRKNWNMEFKDATAAAQAAAESAERASMAARAAAELSRLGQYSTESYQSNIQSPRDEGHTENHHHNPDEDVGKFHEDSHASAKRSSRLGSLRSDGASADDLDKLMNDFLKGARYSQNTSVEEEVLKGEKSAGFSRNNVIRQSSRSDVEFVSSEQGGRQTDSLNYFAEESIIKQNSNVSSHSHTNEGRYLKNSSEEAAKAETSTGFSGMNVNKQSIESGAEFLSSQQGDIQSDSFNYFAEESIRKTNSSVSSHSRSSSHGDDYDVSPFSHPKYENDDGKDPFDHRNVHIDTAQASSYSNAAVIFFDEPVSDDDHHIMFDTPKFDRQYSDLYPRSPVIESPSQLPLNTDTWSPRQNMTGSLEKFPSVSHVSVEGHSPPKFDESSTKSAKPDEFLPLTFDESEGPSSESEDEVNHSRLGRKTDPSSLPQKENIFFRSPDYIEHESQGLTGSFLTEKGDAGSNRKKDLNYSSDDDLDEVNKQETEFTAQARRKFGFDEEPIPRSSAGHSKSQMISNDMAGGLFYTQVEETEDDPSAETARFSLVDEVKTSNDPFPSESSFNMKDDELSRHSSLESGNELQFGKLTGGLRHKGFLRPPYRKSPSGDALPSKKAAEEIISSIESSPSFSSVKNSVKSGVSAKVGNKSSSRTPIADSESDSDESEEELPQRNLSSKREPDSHTSSKEVDNNLRLRDRVTFFDSDSDSVEDVPKKAFNSTGRVGSGFSRRTKATTSSGTSSRSKATVGSEASEPNSEADARKTPSMSSYRFETPPNLRSQTETSSHWESPPEPKAEKQSTSRLKPESSSSGSSFPSETPPNPRSQTENLGIWGRSPPEPTAVKQSFSKPMPESNFTRKKDLKSSGIEQPSSRQDNLKSSAEQATSKPKPESNISMREENLKSSPFERPFNRQEKLQSSAKQATSKPMPASNFSSRKQNPKSSATEQLSSPLRPVTSASTGSLKSSTLSVEQQQPPSREGSLNKPSHVHPKLPDYDIIAAQFQSLRSNR